MSSTAGRGPGCSSACSSGRRTQVLGRRTATSSARSLAARLGQPDAEQLARVVPLVERLGGVDALEALQPDQRGVEQRRRATWRPASCPRRPRPRAAAAAAGVRRRTATPASDGVGEVAHVGETAYERRGVGDQVVEAHVVAYFAGSATYARRQPGQQNQTRSPSTSANSASSDDRDGHAAHRVDRGLGLEADDSEAGHRRLGDGRVRAGVRGARHPRALAHHLREHATARSPAGCAHRCRGRRGSGCGPSPRRRARGRPRPRRRASGSR